MRFRLTLLALTIASALLQAQTNVTTPGSGTMTTNGVVYANAGASVVSTSVGGTNTVLMGTSSAPSFSGTPRLTGIGLGAAGSATVPLVIAPTAATVSGAEANIIYVNLGASGVQFASGFTQQRSVLITQPTYTAASMGTIITTAATFDIQGPQSPAPI